MLCHVNLIPVNPTSEGPYERTSRADAETFQRELRRFGVPSTVRMEKGIDIDAGCGQLRASELWMLKPCNLPSDPTRLGFRLFAGMTNVLP